MQKHIKLIQELRQTQPNWDEDNAIYNIAMQYEAIAIISAQNATPVKSA